MKPEELHVEYDSPIEINFTDSIIESMSKEIAEHIDNETFQAVLHAGFYIDREKMVAALKQDKHRYEEAYSRGYSKGREDRDKHIVRCKDCEYWLSNTEFCTKWSVNCHVHHTSPDWYCADAERREDEDDE